MNKRVVIFSVCSIAATSLQAQTKKNTDTVRVLQPVVVTTIIKDSVTYLADIIGNNVFAGKHTNAVKPDGSTANLAQNNIRQAFAKIPGITTWDMDGAGTQLNIGTRGTDSHRSIEMNMRQNGYNTNSDIFGYPEDHYTVPLQAVKEVQYLRGSAALQFGSQFGGMMNFVMKDADSSKSFSFESEQTRGSNNFFNSFNAAGGTTGKLSYYSYYDNRSGDGWRPNAAFSYHAYHANLTYHFTAKNSLSLQFSRMDYLQQIAGGLTDAQFNQNAQTSLRARNFFRPEINIAALNFKSELSADTKLEITIHGLWGERNSVQFINTPDVRDTFNTSLSNYNPRQVDRDYYKAFTTEARLLHHYSLDGMKAVFSGGIRFSNETTLRKQKGVGTTGSDFDLSLVKPYGIDLRFVTNNYALFAENIFYLTKKLSVTPGIRYEIINSQLIGVINNAGSAVGYTGSRSFPLFGTGLQYQAGRGTQLYANISQAYRPFLYASITPADRLDVIDPNLKDSKGYDMDLGYRGNYKSILHFDVNLFYVFYGNRAGLLTQTDATGTHLLTTNIGDAVSKGVEACGDLTLLKWNNGNEGSFSIFNSLSYTHARYTNTIINKSGINTNINGNYVENTPEFMNKTGLQLQAGGFSTSLQHSYSSSSYNDALNTLSSGNDVTGKIPAYHLWDFSASYSFGKSYRLSGGINNLSNEQYFNRRITMYPGPGILPADGRTWYLSFAVKM